MQCNVRVHSGAYCRVINGVKDMEGFQITFNLSVTGAVNDSEQCSGSADIGESTILVCHITSTYSLI